MLDRKLLCLPDPTRRYVYSSDRKLYIRAIFNSAAPTPDRRLFLRRRLVPKIRERDPHSHCVRQRITHTKVTLDFTHAKWYW